jgi:hypothetical protein
MCIVNLIPRTSALPDFETFQQCWFTNPHGAGYAYAKRGMLIVRKGFMDVESLYKVWRIDFPTNDPDPVNRPHAVSLHFRIGTHGDNTPQNTHPWTVVKDKCVLLHNGILRNLDPGLIRGAMAGASDSQWFAALVRPIVSAACSKANPGSSIFLKPDGELTSFAFAFRELTEAFIAGGYPNKIVFMDHEGGFMVAGASKGVMDPKTGIWWSNDGFRLGTDGAACDPRGRKSEGKTVRFERFKTKALLTGSAPSTILRPKVLIDGEWQEPHPLPHHEAVTVF